MTIRTTGFPGSRVVKNQPVNAGDAGDTGDVSSFPGWGRPPGGGNGNHCSILAWEIPWTEETGGLEPTGSQSQT